MKYLVRMQRLKLRFTDGDDGDSVANGVEDFERVPSLLAGTARVDLDDGSHVPAPEPVLGQVSLEGDPAEELV